MEGFFINYATHENIKLLVREITKLHFQTEKDMIHFLQRAIL